jgi:hypothetical protein
VNTAIATLLRLNRINENTISIMLPINAPAINALNAVNPASSACDHETLVMLRLCNEEMHVNRLPCHTLNPKKRKKENRR